jgi:hypothetical protein
MQDVNPIPNNTHKTFVRARIRGICGEKRLPLLNKCMLCSTQCEGQQHWKRTVSHMASFTFSQDFPLPPLFRSGSCASLKSFGSMLCFGDNTLVDRPRRAADDRANSLASEDM